MTLFSQSLVAFIVGALLMYGYTRIRGAQDAEVRALKARLEAKTAELETYKQDVQEHFLETAEAIDSLTQSYRSVFEQLEADANRLVGETRFRGALKDRAVKERGTPNVIVVDETLPEKAREKSAPQLSRSA